MQKALITGAAGFAGGHLIEYLLARGDSVLGIDRTTQWTLNSPSEEITKNVPLLAWDLGSNDTPSEPVWEQIRDFTPTVIYHLAAVSIPKYCGTNEITPLAEQVNIGGTRRIIHLAQRLYQRTTVKPLLLFFSSSRVYGNMDSPNANRFCNESAELHPKGGYALSKRRGEELILNADAEGLIDAMIIRPFQHTGPRQTGELMLPDWLNQIQSGVAAGKSQITVNTRCLDTIIDLTDVRDMARGYALCADFACDAIHDAVPVYNMGSGSVRSCREIFDLLAQIAARRLGVEITPRVENVLPDFPPFADCSRLEQNEIDWTPEIDLESTLTDALKWKFPVK